MPPHPNNYRLNDFERFPTVADLKASLKGRADQYTDAELQEALDKMIGLADIITAAFFKSHSKQNIATDSDSK